RLHGGTPRVTTGDGGGCAHRRCQLVAAAVARARAADSTHHRAPDRDPGDHGSLLGLQLRVRPHVGRARLCLQRDGAVHLAELLERLERDGGGGRGDAVRHGERADRTVALGAKPGGVAMGTTTGGPLVGALSRHAFLIIICPAALSPLYFIAATAIRSNAAYQLNPTGSPSPPTLSALRSMILHQPLPRWMWNSFLVTVSSVAVSTFIALLAAYGAVFGRFRGHKMFLSTSVALMVVPPVTLLVPMFIFMVDTGFVNHLQSVIIFYTGLLVP